FQAVVAVVSGIQTSRLMCESGLGVDTTATRQNAGRLLNVCPLGAVNEPAGTDWASVTVACGSMRLVRLLQVAANADGAEMTRAAAARAATNMRRSMFFPRVCARCGAASASRRCCLARREIKTRRVATLVGVQKIKGGGKVGRVGKQL